MRKIDLRRDTITLPSERMRERAWKAELGDSAYGEDLSQAALEELTAERLGKEAALFFPSGTMANLTAVLAQTRRGDAIITEESAHIRTSETGGASALAGVMVHPIRGASGLPDIEGVRGAIKEEDIHHPSVSLLCMESSHYRYGGIVPPLKEMKILSDLAGSRGVRVHLDGARIFNSAVFLKKDVKEIASTADTVMVSLSKGLASPVGSLLCGNGETMERAKRFRKMLGGGMRQTGWLCACGIEALSTENIALLEEDHNNAEYLADSLASLTFCTIDLTRVQTNFVDLKLSPEIDGEWLVNSLAEQGILLLLRGKREIRFCFSREVTRADTEFVVEAVRSLLT
jgi:threonine aldolase